MQDYSNLQIALQSYLDVDNRNLAYSGEILRVRDSRIVIENTAIYLFNMLQQALVGRYQNDRIEQIGANNMSLTINGRTYSSTSLNRWVGSYIKSRKLNEQLVPQEASIRPVNWVF